MKKLWYIARGDIGRLDSAESIHSINDVKAFIKLGWNAKLFGSNFSNSENLDSFFMPVTKKKFFLERIFFELFIILRLLFTTKANRPNLIFFRGPTNLLLIMYTLKLLGIPFSIEINGAQGYLYGHGSFLRKRIERYTDRFSMNNASAIFCVTPELVELVKSKFDYNANVIYSENGVNIEDYPYLKNSEIKKNFKIAFIGKAYPGRGLELLIQSLANLRKNSIICNAKLIGGGPLYPELMRIAKEYDVLSQIEFQDSVEPKFLKDELVDCNLSWAVFEEDRLQTITGLSPLKVWTSLSLGIPVLAFGPRGFRERLISVPGVFIADSYNEIAISKILISIIKDYSKKYGQFGADGRKYVESNISWLAHCKIKDVHLKKIKLSD